MAAVAVLLVPSVAADGTHTPGSVLAPVFEGKVGGGLALGDSALPYDWLRLPNGILFYRVDNVGPGMGWRFSWDDGVEAFVVGTSSSCPGPRPADDYESGLPTEGTTVDNYGDLVAFWVEDPQNNVWLYCRIKPDFDVWLVCSDGARAVGGPSGQEPIVPDCEGSIYVVLVFGDPGEAFEIHEGI